MLKKRKALWSLGSKSGIWFLSPRIPCCWALWACGSETSAPSGSKGQRWAQLGKGFQSSWARPHVLRACPAFVHAHACVHTHTHAHTPCHLPVGSVGVQVGEEASAGCPEVQPSRAETGFLCSHLWPHNEESPGLCHTYCWAYFLRTEVGAVSRRVPWEEGDRRESK